MPKMSNVELFELREQPTLTIRATVPAQGLPELIAKSYARIGEYLAELGVGICDVPFVIYYNMDVDALDVEIGFPDVVVRYYRFTGVMKRYHQLSQLIEMIEETTDVKFQVNGREVKICRR